MRDGFQRLVVVVATMGALGRRVGNGRDFLFRYTNGKICNRHLLYRGVRDL